MGMPTQVSRSTSTGLRATEPAGVAGLSLAVARIVVGATAVLSATRILAYGWIDSLIAGPPHRLAYPGLWWVPQPSHSMALLLVVTMGGAGLAITAGWRTRAALVAFLVSFCWLEAVDATTYLNHYWFLTLFAGLLLVAPSGAALSLDARRVGSRRIDPLWIRLARTQVAVVYVYAAVAKIQLDWMVHGLPLRLWLPARADMPMVGPLLAEPAVAHALAIAGLGFDLAIVPLLLWRRTRLAAWLALVAFHLATWLLFPIGVFPWVMIGASTVFFAPDWPRRFGIGSAPSAPPRRTRLPTGARAALVVAWCLIQVLVPLRHLMIPGDARWTGEGYRLAWNVLAVESSGEVVFRVTDLRTGLTDLVDPRTVLTENQLRVVATEPELIRQTAHLIAADQPGPAEVRADAWVSLNGRPPARLVNPEVDLAAQPASWGHRTWILPAPAQTAP